MNMISTGSFLTETSASTKQSELVKTLTSAWEKKNSKAARAGGVSLMALSLAACGSSEDTTPFSQADLDAAAAAAKTAAETAAAASEAAAVAAANAAAATAAEAAAATAAADKAAAVAAAEATAAEAAATAAAELAALQASYDALANPAAASLALTSSTDIFNGTTSNDTFTGTQATLAAADIIVDSSSTDNDTVNITSSTADLTAITTTMSGIENVNFNFTTFAEAKIGADNIKSGTVTINQLQAGGSADGTVDNANGITVVGGTGITGTLTVNQDDLGATTTINAGNAATVTHTIAGGTKANVVVVNGSTASTSLTAAAGALGSATINGTATDVTLNASGKTVVVNSAYTGTTTTASAITVTGGAGTADTATVTLGGEVGLTNNANIEQLNLSGFAASTVDLGAAIAKLDLQGSNDITVKGLIAEVGAAKTITSTGTGNYTVRITDTLGGDVDFSKTDTDVTIRVDINAANNHIKVKSGATIDYRDAGGDALELVSSATAGTAGESINVVANAAATSIINGTAGTGAGADRFETINVTSSTVAVTGLTVLAGDAALTLGGSKAITLAGTSTAASVTNNGVTATYTIDGTSDIATITGSATALDTILISETAGDDLSDNTISNIDIIKMTKAGAVQQTLVLDSSQVNGKTLTIDGVVNAGTKDLVTIDANTTTVDLSGITVDSTDVGTITVNLTGVAGAATNITGSNGVDALSNQGTGVITFDGKGGADVLTGGSGADVLTGGEGADSLTGAGGNDTYNLAEVTAATDTVNFDWAAGEKDTVNGFTAGSASTKDVFSIDFSDITDVVTEVANLDDAASATAAGGDTVLIQKITAGTAFDLGTSTADTNVIAFDGNFASAAELATAINSGGNTALKFGGAFTAGDAMLALYDNGTSTTFAYISSAIGVADDAVGTDLTVTDLAVFSDIADATSILAGNLAFA